MMRHSVDKQPLWLTNSTLYTMCFTGMASSTKRSELCFTSTYTEQECAQQGDPDPSLKDRLKAIETAVLALSNKQEQGSKPTQQAIKPSAEPCRKWNSVRCTCRHSHLCSSCGGNHPATKCSTYASPYGGQRTYNQTFPLNWKPLPPPNKPS